MDNIPIINSQKIYFEKICYVLNKFNPNKN